MNFIYHKFVEFFETFDISSNISTFIFSPIPFAIIMSSLMFSVILLVLAERKLLGYFTQRKGPNRVGKWGILQTVADGIKLLCKENITPINTDKILFTLSPIMTFTAIGLLWCVTPFNAEFCFFNSSISLIIFYAISTLPILFNFLAGSSSNNKYSQLGAFRGILLFISYTIPTFLVILSIVCIANTLNLKEIIEEQTRTWYIFYDFIGFCIFYICILAKLHRCPFDLTEAESELVCGFHTEYSGMRFAMFFLGEYAELIILSMFLIMLFLGGYLPPFNIYLSNILLGNCSCSKYLIYFEQTAWLILKTIFIVFSIIWVRASQPRLKQRTVLNIFWRYLNLIALINLFIILVLNLR